MQVTIMNGDIIKREHMKTHDLYKLTGRGMND